MKRPVCDGNFYVIGAKSVNSKIPARVFIRNLNLKENVIIDLPHDKYDVEIKSTCIHEGDLFLGIQYLISGNFNRRKIMFSAIAVFDMWKKTEKERHRVSEDDYEIMDLLVNDDYIFFREQNSNIGGIYSINRYTKEFKKIFEYGNTIGPNYVNFSCSDNFLHICYQYQEHVYSVVDLSTSKQVRKISFPRDFGHELSFQNGKLTIMNTEVENRYAYIEDFEAINGDEEQKHLVINRNITKD
jgi:hypothetical protein